MTLSNSHDLLFVALMIEIGLSFLRTMVDACVFSPWQRALRSRYKTIETEWSGIDLAAMLLKENRISGVNVETVAARKLRFGDHFRFNLGQRTVELDEILCSAKNVVAYAIASHTAAHAIQRENGYRVLRVHKRGVTSSWGLSSTSSREMRIGWHVP